MRNILSTVAPKRLPASVLNHLDFQKSANVNQNTCPHLIINHSQNSKIESQHWTKNWVQFGTQNRWKRLLNSDLKHVGLQKSWNVLQNADWQWTPIIFEIQKYILILNIDFKTHVKCYKSWNMFQNTCPYIINKM